MKKYCFIICMVFFLACDREEITPRTNPQFSVAFIQEIDAEGAEFSANIFDYGTDEILEYGFVFDRTASPRVDHSEVLKEAGRPGKTFTMKATHSLVVGQKYHVAAFIRTSSSVIYSKPESFVSKGAKGFFLERIEHPEKLYFGDTLTFYGKDFSRISSTYNIIFQSIKLQSFNYGENSFQVKLPEMFPVPATEVKEFDLLVEMAGKSLAMKKIIDFQDPVFEEEEHRIDYSDTVTIRGQYLRSQTVRIQSGNSVLQILKHNDEEITFIPRIPLTTTTPDLMVTVRGRDTILKKKIKFNPTSIKTGQIFNIALGETITLEGKNFNPFFHYIHELNSSNGEFFYKGSSGKNPGTIDFRIQQIIPVPRHLIYYFQTLGSRDESTVEINLINPAMRHFAAGSLNIMHLWPPGDKMVSYDGLGILFRRNQIHRIDPISKKIVFLLHSSNEYRRNKITVNMPNGNIFVCQEASEEGGPYVIYDPLMNAIVKEGMLPNNSPWVNAAFATDKYFYCQDIARNENKNPTAHRYNIQTGQWEVIGTYIDLSINQFRPYYYQNELYALCQNTGGNTEIKRFDQVSEKWSTVKSFPFPLDVNTPEVFIIEGYIYATTPIATIRISLSDYSIETATNIGGVGTHSLFSFISNNKYYVLNPDQWIYEYDPFYLKF